MKNEIWSNFDFSRQLFKTLNFILYKFVGNFLKINGNSSFSRVNYGFIFKWEGGRGGLSPFLRTRYVFVAGNYGTLTKTS